MSTGSTLAPLALGSQPRYSFPLGDHQGKCGRGHVAGSFGTTVEIAQQTLVTCSQWEAIMKIQPFSPTTFLELRQEWNQQFPEYQ